MKRVEKNRGFTLIEILVAVLVAGILISAVYQVLVNQNRVYVVEEQNIEMQQNARAALDFMARELRLSGFGVADDDDRDTNVFVDLINNADSNTEGVDAGTDAIIFTAGVGNGSWVAEETSSGNLVRIYPATDKSFEFEASQDRPILVDFIAFFDNRKLKLNHDPVTVTNVSHPTKNVPFTILQLENNLQDELEDEAKPYGLVIGDQVVVCSQTIRYSVDGGSLKRSLSDDGGDTWSTVQTLINNVEDLQLSYSFDDDDDDYKPDMDMPANKSDPLPGIIWANDNNSSGVLSEKVLPCGKTESLDSLVAYRSDANVLDGTIEQEIGDPSRNPLRGIKVSLVVRSGRQNPDHRFRKLFAPLTVQDHTPKVIAKDGYRRRVFEREIPFRNLGLNPTFTNEQD